MKFAVAAGHALTTEAAAEALRAGGTAVDAAIAGALAACVAEPVLASPLGGGFLMVREPEGRTWLLDFFVQTPKRKISEGEMDFRAIEADFGEVTQVFHIGAASVATPGVAPGLAEAHARYGRVPLPELAAPAARAARNGVALSAFQAHVLDVVSPIFEATEGVRALYSEGERLKADGEIVVNPAMGDVIETFAHEGPRFVQEGEVAAALLSLDGGNLTREDLKAYEPIWRDPLIIERGSARLSLNPVPSLGGALIAFSLRLLPPHAGAAALAHAFAATSRARLAVDLNRDPQGGAARLFDPELVARYRAEVDKASTQGTTHISAVDASGMGAALTLSNGAGSGLIAPGTGIMPNNMLGEEDLNPGDWHEWTPDRRLSSMMAPMAIDGPDGTAAMLGSGGSNRIRTALAQVAARLIDGGADLEAAIGAPRLHVEGAKELKVDFEDRFAEQEREALLAAFSEAQAWARDSMFFGGVHGVRRGPKGDVEAAGDPRRGGVAANS